MHVLLALPLCSLAILFACASRLSKGSRVVVSPSEVEAAVEANPSSGPTKFIFMRHGESQGNAGVAGAFEQFRTGQNRKFTGYMDGKLTPLGEQQVYDRVHLMDSVMLKQLAEAELVLVSPLSRTLATAVLMLAAVRSRCEEMLRVMTVKGLCVDVWPTVRIDVGLREKIQSQSEMPNCGEHSPLEYLDELSVRVQGVLPNVSEGHLARFVGAMKSHYVQTFQHVTRIPYRHTCVDWNPLPDNGFSFMHMIEDFKSRVAQLKVDSVVLVSHSGWGRYAFGPYLPRDGDREMKYENLVRGSRPASSLNNCGVAFGEINSAGRFQNVQISRLSPGNVLFPNTKIEGKLGFFSSAAEAESAGVTPAGSCMDRFILKKRMQFKGYHETRMFTLAWAGGIASITWATKWGQAKRSWTMDSKFTVVVPPEIQELVREGGSFSHSLQTVRGRVLNNLAEIGNYTERPTLKIERESESFTVRTLKESSHEEQELADFARAIDAYRRGKPC